MGTQGLTEQEAQAAWDELANEREADTSPVETPASVETDATAGNQEFEPQVQASQDEATPKAEAPKEEAPAEPAKQPEDPFANLPQAVKDRLNLVDQLVETMQQMKRHVSTAEGRVAAMQREMSEAKKAATAVDSAPTKAQIEAASASPEKWEAMKQDFPEWAEATEAMVSAKLAGLTPQQAQGLTPEQVQDLVQAKVEDARKEALKAVEEAKVEGKYENWREDIQSQDFASWFNQQPAEVKALAESPKGRDAIRMLDLWHESKKAPVEEVQAQRSSKLAAAVTVKPGASPAAKTVDQMTPDELWNYEAKLRAKRASNGLTY